MAVLAVARVHHATADLDLREQFSALAAALPVAPDLVPLLTCHRAELYAAIPEDVAEPRQWFAQRLSGLPVGVDVAAGEEAVVHLFRVAAGLDSAIAGERQILGQVRASYESARERRVASELAGAFERALHLGRALRQSTPLGRATASLGSLAVSAALARVADPARATVVVLGAGEMGKLASRALAQRVSRLVVVNRDPVRAAAVAGQTGGSAVGLDGLADALATADALISAADTRGEILTSTLLGPHVGRGLIVVDIAMPRSVGAETRELLGAGYVTVDDLVPAEDAIDPAERADLEARCAEAATGFLGALRARGAGETIARLRERAEDVRRRRLERALRDLGHLSERDRRVIETFSCALTNALVHEPITALREAPERVPAARDLFRL